MKIDITYTRKVDEGTLVYALIRRVERPPVPHHEAGDTDEVRDTKGDIWKNALDEFAVEDKEVKTLHLGKAILIQKYEE